MIHKNNTWNYFTYPYHFESGRHFLKIKITKLNYDDLKTFQISFSDLNETIKIIINNNNSIINISRVKDYQLKQNDVIVIEID